MNQLEAFGVQCMEQNRRSRIEQQEMELLKVLADVTVRFGKVANFDCTHVHAQ